MQRFIGSICIVLACTGIGFKKVSDLKQHVNELEQLKMIFTMIQSEMKYMKVPCDELFEKVCHKVNGVYASWLQGMVIKLRSREEGCFQVLWQKSISEYLEDAMLTKEEKYDLEQLGKEFAYEEALELYLEKINFSIEKAHEEFQNNKKVYQSIGVLGGVFLVIILW